MNGATNEQDHFMAIKPPTDGPKSTLLLRLMAGGVFFWEGLLKFVMPTKEFAVSQNWEFRFHTSRPASSGALRSLVSCCCLLA
jgi:uncharacterized membrane protein YphA (DoxX/SURF4 family)